MHVTRFYHKVRALNLRGYKRKLRQVRRRASRSFSSYKVASRVTSNSNWSLSFYFLVPSVVAALQVVGGPISLSFLPCVDVGWHRCWEEVGGAATRPDIREKHKTRVAPLLRHRACIAGRTASVLRPLTHPLRILDVPAGRRWRQRLHDASFSRLDPRPRSRRQPPAFRARDCDPPAAPVAAFAIKVKGSTAANKAGAGAAAVVGR